jgi:hypothetical protein
MRVHQREGKTPHGARRRLVQRAAIGYDAGEP